MKKFAQITAVVLVAVLALTVLVACGYSGDPKKAVAQLEKQGYKAVCGPGGLKTEAVVTATKKDDNKLTTIVITYYKEASDAKDAYKKEKESLEEVKDFNKEHGIKTSVSISGKQVILKTVVNG